MLHGQRNNAGTDPDVIPFGRGGKRAPAGNNDQLDKAGQTILQLLNKAADVAEGNSRHAIDMAQKLSHQLRAAEDRIAELQARGRGPSRAGRSRGAVATHRLYGNRRSISESGPERSQDALGDKRVAPRGALMAASPWELPRLIAMDRESFPVGTRRHVLNTFWPRVH